MVDEDRHVALPARPSPSMPSSSVEAVDEKTSRVHADSDTAEMLAFYLGLLGADFTVDQPDEHSELPVGPPGTVAGTRGQSGAYLPRFLDGRFDLDVG
jgi:hypothetical protein